MTGKQVAGPYDVLFEPVKIGPVVAKNRFYQVPHCTGSGWARPRILADMREVKAEGGWGVVNTEYCSIHPSSDDPPHPCASLWDDGDIRAHALMTEKVHAHGALAGVELCIGGARMANLETRETPLSVGNLPNLAGNPFQCRQMDRQDIRDTRRWHRNAALRAKAAGFDIVYVYATHGYLLSQFMSKTTNARGDEYGGSLENRIRLVREVIEDTKDAVGDTMAVAVRFSAETNGGNGRDGSPVPGETEDIFGMIGELPDLWDININDYSLEMGLSRFVQEGSLEPYVASIKSMTSKPVVSVGRFTSPDTMVSQIKRGVLDFIGAARPSIADPFLPNKIRDGRVEDIRECIGCNICYMGDGKGVPIRCTQNPTISEEWRRGWHPEKIAAKRTDATVLVVGAGPTGLEAAHALGKRGYKVLLAEATRDLGGRVSLESKLPGLNQWARVRNYRVQQIDKLENVEVFRESKLTAEQVLELGVDHIAIATGATWRRDGYGADALAGIKDLGPLDTLLTPDDIMAGHVPDGPTIVYDDDHYYMGSVIAELLRSKGVEVTLMTPSDVVSSWGAYTYDRWRAQTRLMEVGVKLRVSQSLKSFDGEQAVSSCTYTGREMKTAATSIVLVTARQPNDDLYWQLHDLRKKGRGEGIKSIKKIGDCDAPAIIAAAVFSGHRYARELDEIIDTDNPLKHDRVFFEDA
ncbi:MAG: dimethylamine/trimethylamine dehydrogenase [Paracoccaceae bacterium]|jgi:dimethylamine/trimethylamine dehydrogenase